jgi:uncharacterized protein
MYYNSNYSDPNYSLNGWIRTFTGKRFYPLQPRLQDIDITDITHALSLQCRFTGHCICHYSVAEHSLLVASLVPEEHQLQALLHDASEAYLTDVARPVKHSPEYTFYRKVEKHVQSLIYEYFNCDPEEAPELKKADDAALGLEAYWLMEVRRGEGWDSYLDEAEARWER